MNKSFRILPVVLLAGFGVLTFACGGAKTTRNERIKSLPKASPEALREFDAGMRALRLRGPEARERAKTRLLNATRLDGKLWEAWHNIGILHYKEGNDRAAVNAFSRALDVNPRSASTRLARAEASRRSQSVKTAIADYRAIISRDPETRLSYARLASVYRETKRYEDGLDTIREALRVAGADSEIYVELALIYLAQGRDELAELVLRRALILDAKEPTVHNAIALVLLSREKDQAAFSSFDKATSLDPQYLDARFNAASVLLDSGDYKRAESLLERLEKTAPDDFDAQVALGIAKRGNKDFRGAKSVWERVAERAPRRSGAFGDALWNLAVLEADIKMEDASAKRALDRYLRESPKNHPKRKQATERRKEFGT